MEDMKDWYRGASWGIGVSLVIVYAGLFWEDKTYLMGEAGILTAIFFLLFLELLSMYLGYKDEGEWR